MAPGLGQTLLYDNDAVRGGARHSLPVQPAEVIAPYAGEFQESLQNFSGVGRGGMGVVYGARLREPAESSIATMKRMVAPFVKTALRGRTEHLLESQQDEVCSTLRENIDTIRGLVAVKVLTLPPDPVQRRQILERFIGRETRMMIMSKLPGCPKVYCGVENDGQAELCMEFVEGFNGAQLNAAVGEQWDVRLLCELAAHEARVLYHAHEEGIIHRDVKPSNFMVTPEGHMKLMDFGLVKPADPAASKYTQEHQILGTPDYMSPEQARGDLSVDDKTDIYSYGVMLIERLTGQIPHRGPGGNAARTIEQRQNISGPPSLAAYREGVLPTISQPERVFVERYLLPMLRRMTERDPAKRPTMSEVAVFFQRASSFGSPTFETEWIPHEEYTNHRLMLLPPEGDQNGDFVIDNAHTMMEALERGLSVRTRDFNFLEHLDALQYAGGAETVDLPGRKSPVRAISLGVGGLVLLTVGGIVYFGSREGGNESPTAAAQPAGVGAAPNNGNAEKPKEFPSPTVVLESENNLATKLRLFEEDPVEIDKLISMYTDIDGEHGTEKKLCGAMFFCDEEILRRLMKLKSIDEIPDRVRRSGGQVGYYVFSNDGRRHFLHITSVAKVINAPTGAVSYTDVLPWAENRGGMPESAFIDALARGTIVLNFPHITGHKVPVIDDWPMGMRIAEEKRPNTWVAEDFNRNIADLLRTSDQRANAIRKGGGAAPQ